MFWQIWDRPGGMLQNANMTNAAEPNQDDSRLELKRLSTVGASIFAMFHPNVC
jgi:hypothetical protein